ncbi:MAG: 50S ribosomal protein L4 [Flavobacteriales bacterium]|jgi:large subunit ribosomal protein L4|nr:50S ribosomal protein L4 [Flavobacteriales bacterium]
MEIAVLDISGKDTGRKVSLNDSIFGIEPNEHVLYLDVKQYLANQRQGTHKAKERGEIQGSTRKIKKQKGTGTARAGSRKSPVMVGGGRAFGPRPRNYGFKLNKKVKTLARKSALSSKVASSEVIVVENFELANPSTKEFRGILANLGLTDAKSLLVLGNENKNVYLSSRNLPKAKVLVASDINAYAVLNGGKIVLTEGALESIENLLS